MTSKTDSNNLASAVTETFITQAERIIRSHDDFCIGYYETTEPWCAAAPVGTPLCRGCRALADKITKAMRTLHQERDEARQSGWANLYLEAEARVAVLAEENRTLKAQLEQVRDLATDSLRRWREGDPDVYAVDAVEDVLEATVAALTASP